MSFKAKDLEYDANEPAFLRRLRSGMTSTTDDPDRRSNAAVGRGFARKAKNYDEDDGPTYVLEGSETTLSKDEAEKLLKSSDGKSDSIQVDATKRSSEVQIGTSANENDTEPTKHVQQTAGAGLNSRKRKAIKVLDADGDEAETQPNSKAKSAKPKALKKKTKAIKLSFDDDEG